jgi:dTDP-4-dehydrorhamnose reductase
MQKGQTVLVTGPRGLLGASVCEVLQLNGYEVVVFDGDIRDKHSVDAAVRAGAPTWVLHTAAKTNVAACEQNPDEARAVNVAGTQHIVEAARACGAVVLHISTASVFKGDVGNYREHDELFPTNVYNQTKCDAEKVVLAYEKGKVVRLTIIGIHQDGSRGRNFLEWLVDSFKNNTDITLFTDSRINPLSNWTIAEMLQKILTIRPTEQIFHIGSSDVISKAEIGKLVSAYFPNYSGAVREGSLESIQDGVFRPKEMWLNTDQTAGVLGLTMPTVEAEIARIFSKQPFQ